MKKITSLFIALMAGTCLNAQVNYYVSVTGDDNNDGLSLSSAKSQIKAAINAACTNNDETSFIINVSEGEYLSEADIQILNSKKIHVKGAGADKTIVRKSYEDFILDPEDMTDFTNPGRLFQLKDAKHKNIELILEGITFENIGFTNTNGGAVVNANAGEQKVTLKACKFRNIVARAGAVVQMGKNEETQSLTIENCYFENCASQDNRDMDGIIIIKGGTFKLSDSQFVNCYGIANNRGEDGLDANRKKGILVSVFGNTTALIENCHFANNKLKSGDNDKYHPIVSFRTINVEGSEPLIPNVNIKNSSFAGNIRNESKDCDILVNDGITPTYENVLIANTTLYSQIEDNGVMQDYFNTLTQIPGAEIASPKIESVYEMNGDNFVLKNDALGIPKLNYVYTDLSSTITSSNVKISVSGNNLIVECLEPSNMNIYNLLGNLINSSRNKENAVFQLSSGIYIISVNKEVFKVSVK